MKKETYIKMTRPFRENLKMAKGLHIINLLCTVIMYVCYPALLLYLIIMKDAGWMQVLFVPAISFLVLSLGRYAINRKRPYEMFEVPPVIPKETKGKSFPSRHVFSAMMIAMTFVLMSPWPWFGAVLLGVTLLEAVVRVVSGVHYISDVLAGILVGLVASCIYLI